MEKGDKAIQEADGARRFDVRCMANLPGCPREVLRESRYYPDNQPFYDLCATEGYPGDAWGGIVCVTCTPAWEAQQQAQQGGQP